MDKTAVDAGHSCCRARAVPVKPSATYADTAHSDYPAPEPQGFEAWWQNHVMMVGRGPATAEAWKLETPDKALARAAWDARDAEIAALRVVVETARKASTAYQEWKRDESWTDKFIDVMAVMAELRDTVAALEAR